MFRCRNAFYASVRTPSLSLIAIRVTTYPRQVIIIPWPAVCAGRSHYGQNECSSYPMGCSWRIGRRQSAGAATRPNRATKRAVIPRSRALFTQGKRVCTEVALPDKRLDVHLVYNRWPDTLVVVTIRRSLYSLTHSHSLAGQISQHASHLQ